MLISDKLEREQVCNGTNQEHNYEGLRSKDAVKIGDTGIQTEVKAAGETMERGRVVWVYDSMKKTRKCEKMRGRKLETQGYGRCRGAGGMTERY